MNKWMQRRLREQRRRWGWLLIDDGGVVDGQMMMTIRVRAWHPGYWLFVARAYYDVRRQARVA